MSCLTEVFIRKPSGQAKPIVSTSLLKDRFARNQPQRLRFPVFCKNRTGMQREDPEKSRQFRRVASPTLLLGEKAGMRGKDTGSILPVEFNPRWPEEISRSPMNRPG